MNDIITMILVCSAVTLLPRIIPYFASSYLARLPRFIRKCMMLLPVAALGALIFPLALTDFGPEWLAGLAGVVFAFAASYFKAPMIVSIIIALAVTSGVIVLI